MTPLEKMINDFVAVMSSQDRKFIEDEVRTIARKAALLGAQSLALNHFKVPLTVNSRYVKDAADLVITDSPNHSRVGPKR